MTSVDEQILRAAKEIVVKFIEVGRVSPNSFPESFREIYDAVYGAVKERPSLLEEKAPAQKK